MGGPCSWGAWAFFCFALFCGGETPTPPPRRLRPRTPGSGRGLRPGTAGQGAVVHGGALFLGAVGAFSWRVLIRQGAVGGERGHCARCLHVTRVAGVGEVRDTQRPSSGSA